MLHDEDTEQDEAADAVMGRTITSFPPQIGAGVEQPTQKVMGEALVRRADSEPAGRRSSQLSDVTRSHSLPAGEQDLPVGKPSLPLREYDPNVEAEVASRSAAASLQLPAEGSMRCADDEIEEPSAPSPWLTYHASQQMTVAKRAIELAEGRSRGSLFERLNHGFHSKARRGTDKQAAWQQSLGSSATETCPLGVSAAHKGAAHEHAHSSPHDCYQYEEDESQVHFEARAKEPAHANFRRAVVSLVLVVIIGAVLGAIASSITIVEGIIFLWKQELVQEIMWSCEHNTSACEAQQEPQVGSLLASYLTYISINSGLVLAAAILTYWAPRAALSGLPPLLAFLNGVRVPELLDFSTLVGKAVGITFVVSTGLPLGREGPMVHTGAIVAARVTRIHLPIFQKEMLEARLPSSQRNWVGMGCAAGVAAAFNAPLGGILYSFEEVCSHWSSVLTWRAFICAVVAALMFNLVILVGTAGLDNGALIRGSFVIGLEDSSTIHEFADFFWYAVIGVIGGVLGSLYNSIVVWGAKTRKRLLGPSKSKRVVEAVVLSIIAFTVYFFLPMAFECYECEAGMNCIFSASGSGSGSGSGSLGAYDASGSSSSDTDGFSSRRLGFLTSGTWYEPQRRRLAGGSPTLSFIQHHCPANHYSPMASLLHSGQEGVIKHLLERSDDADHTFDTLSLVVMLVVYFTIAVLIFGIQVPAGNFVPSMTIGAIMGRLMGVMLIELGVSTAVEPGAYALMGAAAMLGGVTRMTLTLACLLVEVTKDVPALLPMMFVLVIAKGVGDLLTPSFDHGMMHFNHLPFLDEEPPPEFNILTARDVMARSVVVLKEVEKVGDLLAVLKKTPHNGFPIVDVGEHARCTFFAGLLLKRQLLVLLRERMWEHQAKGEGLSDHGRLRFMGSAFTKATEDKILKELQLSEHDREQEIDLRPFMDPSPYVVNELMPLRRVYRLFNEIGVRHLPVVDCREQVVGIITRKDILPETMAERVHSYMHTMAGSGPHSHGVLDAAKSVVRRFAHRSVDVGGRASAMAAAVAADHDGAAACSEKPAQLLRSSTAQGGRRHTDRGSFIHTVEEGDHESDTSSTKPVELASPTGLGGPAAHAI